MNGTISLLTVREMIAETLFALDLVFGIILLHYVWTRSRDYTRWWKYRHIQGAVAILVLISGHLIIRFWSIAIFVDVRRGGNVFDLENRYPVALIGTIIAVIGLCWAIRIFSPDSWGEKSWMAALAFAGLLVATMRLV